MIRAEAASRWRVPLGWVVGVGALYLATPTPSLFAAGLGLAALGEGIRVWAAGHLDKNRRVTMSGPYAWTRNPLYFGSLWMGLGFALATGRWFLVALVVFLFLAVYRPVMKREAAELAERFPAAYQAYAERTPLFWPRSPKRSDREGGFFWRRLVVNREHLTIAGWVAVACLLGWKLL